MTKLWQINNQTEMYDKSEVDWIISALPTWWDMLKSIYDTNDDWIVNQANVITNQWDLATLDNVDTVQITNSAVTNTKLAYMNANTVKGRLSWNGTPQDIAMADLPISTATQSALDLKANDNEVVKLTWNQTIDWVKTFTSIPVLPASNPTTGNEATRKAYVDLKTTFNAPVVITATASQTVFTVNAYITNRIQIFVNWLLQTKTNDYTETNSTTITMVTGLTAWDEFKYIIL